MKKLLIDIENSPNVAHVWGLWNVNVSLSQLRESSYTMCFAAKWKGERKVHFYSTFDHGREAMVQAAHDLLSEADVVGHYNGNSHDIPILNKEFILEGLNPPAPYKSIDYYRVVKKNFKFASGKLEYVADALGIGKKISHEGHMLWVKCMAGDPAAWKMMEKYNKQDVVLLDDLDDKLLPWITNHPNANLFGVDGGCTNCGSGDARKEGYAYTGQGIYQRYQCRTCGTWFQDTRRIDGSTVRQVKF